MNKHFIINVFLFLVGIFFGYEYFNYRNIQKIKIATSTISFNDTGYSIEELKQRIITKGDTSAYKNLRIEYLDRKFYDDEILFYSIIMSNKYCYPPAFFDVYFHLTSIYEHNNKIGKIDNRTIKMALDFLNKGVELNDYDAICKLRDLYLEGSYVTKDSIKAKALSERVIGRAPMLKK